MIGFEGDKPFVTLEPVPFKEPNRHAEYRRARIETNRAWLRELKEHTPCKDCRRRFPFYVMQFDHLRDKRWQISLMLAHSREKIEAEISKCDLVCANCHAVRSWRRRNKIPVDT